MAIPLSVELGSEKPCPPLSWAGFPMSWGFKGSLRLQTGRKNSESALSDFLPTVSRTHVKKEFDSGCVSPRKIRTPFPTSPGLVRNTTSSHNQHFIKKINAYEMSF